MKKLNSQFKQKTEQLLLLYLWYKRGVGWKRQAVSGVTDGEGGGKYPPWKLRYDPFLEMAALIRLPLLPKQILSTSNG